MDFQGKITQKTSKITVGQKNTPKITIVIEETKGQYPNSIMIDCMGDKSDLVEHLEVGSEVAIVYNSNVTTYNDRFYQNNNLYKLEVLSEPEFEDSDPF